MESISENFASQLRRANISVTDQACRHLQRLEANGLLSVGWPTARHSRPSLRDRTSHLARSIVWIPDYDGTLDQVRTTSIVSSRLGREVDQLDPLFFVLRTAVSQLNPDRQRILTAERTSSHAYVRRCSELFGIPLLQVITPTPATSLERWATSAWKVHSAKPAEKANAELSTMFCFVSNPVAIEENQPHTSSPLRDAIEVLASDQLLVLHLRGGGNLNRIVDDRLSEQTTKETSSRVYLALGDDRLVPQSVAEPLMDKGAIGWFTTPKQLRQEEDRSASEARCPLDWTTSTDTGQKRAPVWSRLEDQDQYFVHCTRRAAANWPDQSELDFLDELILGAPSRDRSCFAALSRIIRMQRLLATGESIRDSNAVVSFTSIELDRIAEVRTFRPHRGRWDFEPYGIAIERSWLIASGAREVTYGDDATWDAMSPEERPYFQKVSQTEGSIDWTVEREWRVLGDVDLSDLPPDCGAVFVPSNAEADLLSRVSKWPVVVLDGD